LEKGISIIDIFLHGEKILDTKKIMTILYKGIRKNYIDMIDDHKKGGDDSKKAGQSFIYMNAVTLTTFGYNPKKEGCYV
jgi:hypothetical protein